MPVPSTAIFITILLLSSSFRWRPARAVRQFDPAANRGIRGEPAESFFPPPPHSPGCVVPSSARPSPPEAAAPPLRSSAYAIRREANRRLDAAREDSLGGVRRGLQEPRRNHRLSREVACVAADRLRGRDRVAHCARKRQGFTNRSGPADRAWHLRRGHHRWTVPLRAPSDRSLQADAKPRGLDREAAWDRRWPLRRSPRAPEPARDLLAERSPATRRGPHRERKGRRADADIETGAQFLTQTARRGGSGRLRRLPRGHHYVAAGRRVRRCQAGLTEAVQKA